jgi:hypothetical protein
MNTSQQTGAVQAGHNRDFKLATLGTLFTGHKHRNSDTKIDLKHCRMAQMNLGSKINADDLKRYIQS